MNGKSTLSNSKCNQFIKKIRGIKNEYRINNYRFISWTSLKTVLSHIISRLQTTYKSYFIVLTCSLLNLTNFGNFALASSSTSDANNNDLADLSLEELLEVSISASSLLEVNLLDAGSSVVVVTEDQWRKAGARRMLDAVKSVDSTFVLPSLSGVDVLSVRGFNHLQLLQGFMTTWDSVPLDDLYRQSAQLNLPSINLGVLNKIQVIRGPSSAIYGGNAFHGLMALESFESQENLSDISGLFASNGYMETSFKNSSAVASNFRLNTAIAINGQQDQKRELKFVDPNTSLPAETEFANEFESGTASFSIMSNPNKPLTWEAAVYAYHFDSDGFQGAGPRAGPGLGPNLGGVNSEFYMGRFSVKQNWSKDHSLEINTYLWNVDNQNYFSIFDGTTSSVVNRLTQSEQYRGGFQGIYRRAAPSVNSQFALAVGSERLGVREAQNWFESITDGSFIRFSPNNADGAKRSITSLTFEAHTNWAQDRWRLIYGARLDEYSDIGSNTSPRLGLIFKPNSSSAIKLLYGNAFRPPTVAELEGTPGFVLPNSNIQAEEIDTYELVFAQQKSHWHAQLTLFRSIWKDGIQLTTLPGPSPNRINTNQVESNASGVGFSIQRKSGVWLFDLSGSYVRSQSSDRGEARTIFPKYITNIGLTYDIQAWAAQVHLQQRFFWEASDLDPFETGLEPVELDNYARTDITFFKNIHTSLELYGQIINLFNRENRLPSGFGSINGIPDEKFSLGIGLHYRY